MTTPKQELMRIIAGVPDDAELEDIVRIVDFWMHVEVSRQQALRREGIPHEEVMEEMRRWAAKHDIALQD